MVDREMLARALWFDFVDQQGYPNGQPIWDEMAAWPANDRNNRCEEFRSLARAAIEATHVGELTGELAWIAMFADVRSKDDSRVFARVNRGALRTIAQRALSALSRIEGGQSNV